jgi:hypothetical protein
MGRCITYLCCAFHPCKYVFDLSVSAARTHFTMSLDVDIAPSYNIHQELAAAVAQAETDHANLERIAFVLPGMGCVCQE